MKNQDLFVYLLQITVSPDPFSSHLTNETCSAESTSRIEALTETIKTFFSVLNCNVYYVMYAPNCAEGKHIPPNHFSRYFFGPLEQLSVQQSEHPQRIKRKQVLFYCLTILTFV